MSLLRKFKIGAAPVGAPRSLPPSRAPAGGPPPAGALFSLEPTSFDPVARMRERAAAPPPPPAPPPTWTNPEELPDEGDLPLEGGLFLSDLFREAAEPRPERSAFARVADRDGGARRWARSSQKRGERSAESAEAPPAPRPIDERLAEAREAVWGRVAESRLAVQDTPELRRILELPRRPAPPAAPDQTARYKKPGGTWTLKPAQSAALWEARRCDGAAGAIPIGEGKTLISLLLPAAMGAKRAVLLVRASMRKALKRQIAIYEPHFELPLELISVVAYEDLSNRKHQDILDRIRPDLIIADEAQALRRRSSARGKRFRRYLREHPECRYVPLSGTLLKKNLSELGEPLEFSLHSGSPLPRPYPELQDWSAAMIKDSGVRPGKLSVFMGPEDEGDVRRAVGRRIVETPGVITIGATDRHDVDAALTIRKLVLDIPEEVQRLLMEVRRDWSLEGDAHEDPARHAAVLRQLACGFYYRWAWPGGVVDYEWLDARSAWHRAVRERLTHSIRGQDSVALCASAADSGKWDCPEWHAWKAVKDRPEPPRETVWLDDFLVADAIRRAGKRRAIIWYDHNAVGDRLRTLGIPTYGAGTDAEDATEPVIACSITVQSVGKNLQYRYSTSVVTTWPPDAERAEQMIGRTHRDGQEDEEVRVLWYAHTEEAEAAMEECRARAERRKAITFEPQRVLYASELD